MTPIHYSSLLSRFTQRRVFLFLIRLSFFVSVFLESIGRLLFSFRIGEDGGGMEGRRKMGDGLVG